MANLVEFLVKVKDLASTPLAKIGSSGGRSFSQLETGLSKFSSKVKTVNKSVDETDQKLKELSKPKEVNLNTRQIEKASSKLDELERKKAKIVGANGSGNGSGFGSSFNLVDFASKALVSIGAGAGLGSFLSMGMDREQTNLSFTTMLGGDANRSKSLLGGLNQFANATPFTNDEVIQSGRSLLAFGFDENKILPSLKRVGDVASGLKIPFGELSEIYGKANVQGTLYAEDLNQLAGRGIPVFTELAKVMGVQADQVKKLGSEGKITFPMLEQAFTNMTSKGGLFENMMQKQSETAGGKWSTLMGVAQTKLTDFSESLLPLTNRLIDAGTWLLNNTTSVLSLTGGLLAGAAAYKAITIGTTLWSVATGKMTLAQWGLNTAMLANPVTWVAAGLAAVAAGVIYCWNTFEGFRGFLYGLWESVKTIFSSVYDIIAGALSLSPSQVERGMLKWELVGKNYAKGFNKGVADFRESKGTGSKSLLSFFGGKGADEVGVNNLTPGTPITAPASAKDTAHGISGGGVRNMTINVSKFFDDIHIHAASTQEGFNDFEKRVAEVFMRVLNSGGAIVR